ncbi:MAG: hypothetical protein IJJ13_02200 [Lachnospiraceae bacterium]|nr:hypothetical protein [Lachnospiraceae bacterium]
MADVNMNGFSNTPITQPSPVQTGLRPDQAQKDQKTQADRANAPEKELENVVSVSKDGDTVQASPDGVDKLTEESSVKVTGGDKDAAKTVPKEDDFRTEDADQRAKETGDAGQIDRAKDTADRNKDDANRVDAANDRAKEARDRAEDKNETNALERLKESQEKRAELIKAAQEAQEKRAEAIKGTPEEQKPSEPVRVDVGADSPDRKIETYAGISDQQLSRMYRDGEISKYSYDNEIASREKRAEQLKENNAELNEEMAVEAGVANRTLQNFNAIENAYTKEQTIEEAREATQRLEAMDTVQKVMTQ